MRGARYDERDPDTHSDGEGAVSVPGRPVGFDEAVGHLPPEWASLIETDSKGCWLWTGERTRTLRPVWRSGGFTNQDIGDSVYMLVCGPLPIGDADIPLPLRTCNIRWCVNPDHARWASLDEWRKWWVATDPGKVGKCAKGHLIFGDNCYESPGGTRFCVTCRRAREANRKKPPRTRVVVKYRNEGVLVPAPDDMSEPAVLLKRRYQCPGCRRTFGRIETARKHLQTCFKVPANRACKTCVHFWPGDHESGPSCTLGIPFGTTDTGHVRFNLHCESWSGT